MMYEDFSDEERSVDTGLELELRKAELSKDEGWSNRILEARKIINTLNNSRLSSEEIVNKYDNKIIKKNDPVLSLLFCFEYPACNIEAHKNIIVNSHNMMAVYEFSLSKLADPYRDELEKVIIESEDPYYIGLYNRVKNPSNVKPFSDALLKSKSGLYNAEFITFGKERLPKYKEQGINIEDHRNVVLEYGTAAEIYRLAEDANDYNMDKYGEAILKTKDLRYIFSFMYKYSKKIDSKLLKKQKQLILESGNSNYLFKVLDCMALTDEEFNKFQDSLIKTGDVEKCLNLSKDLRSDTKKIEQIILSAKVPEYSYKFCVTVHHKVKIDIERHQDVILNSEYNIENMNYAIMFAEEISGANVEKIEDYIINSNNANKMCEFAITVHNSNVNKITDKILTMKNVNPEIYHKLSRYVDQEYIPKLLKALKKNGNAEACYWFAYHNHIEGNDLYDLYKVACWNHYLEGDNGDYSTKFYTNLILPYENSIRREYKKVEKKEPSGLHKIINKIRKYKSEKEIDKQLDKYK